MSASQQALPEEVRTAEDSDDCICRTCGRYVGAVEVCPFCRSFNRKRPSVFFLKYASPVLTVLGLLGLLISASAAGAPQVSIRDLGRRSNFAQVEIAGTVSDTPRFYPSERSPVPSAGSLQFEVDDGTGLLKVRCYDDATSELVSARKLPSQGDTVSVRGTYQFKARADLLILASAEDIEVARQQVGGSTALRKLARQDRALKEGMRVRVTGRLREIRFDRYRLILSLEDDGQNVVEARLPSSLLQLCGIPEDRVAEGSLGPSVGDYCTVEGNLSRDWANRRMAIDVALPYHIHEADRGVFVRSNS